MIEVKMTVISAGMDSNGHNTVELSPVKGKGSVELHVPERVVRQLARRLYSTVRVVLDMQDIGSDGEASR